MVHGSRILALAHIQITHPIILQIQTDISLPILKHTRHVPPSLPSSQEHITGLPAENHIIQPETAVLFPGLRRSLAVLYLKPKATGKRTLAIIVSDNINSIIHLRKRPNSIRTLSSALSEHHISFSICVPSAALRRCTLGKMHIIRCMPVASPGESMLHEKLIAQVILVNLMGEVL